MKAQIAFLILLIPLVFYSSTSLVVNGRLSTSFYTFEKYDTVGTSKTYFRGYQTAQFDVTKKNFSVHTTIQAAKTLASAPDEEKLLKFYNLYFRWRNIFDIVDLNVGRHSIFAGVGNGLLDGGSFKIKLFENKFVLAGYGGVNVNPYLEAKIHKNTKDNYLIGGQLVTTFVPDMQLGLSYMNRHRERYSYTSIRPDSLGNAIPRTVNVASPYEQLASGDVSYQFNKIARLYGRYDHDLNLEKTSRAQFSTRINVTDWLAFTGDYIYRQPRIPYNSIFNVFDITTTNEIEGGVEYIYSHALRFFGKFANIQYSGDKSQRYTLGMNAEYGSLTYSGNSGYAGELNSVSAQLIYPLFDRMLIPTIGVSRATYKLTKQGDTFDTFSGIFGAAFRPYKVFFVDAQVQWMSNKVYKNDFRFLFKINYLFNQRLNWL